VQPRGSSEYRPEGKAYYPILALKLFSAEGWRLTDIELGPTSGALTRGQLKGAPAAARAGGLADPFLENEQKGCPTLVFKGGHHKKCPFEILIHRVIEVRGRPSQRRWRRWIYNPRVKSHRHKLLSPQSFARECAARAYLMSFRDVARFSRPVGSYTLSRILDAIQPRCLPGVASNLN
jgi:hypothetical protein